MKVSETGSDAVSRRKLYTLEWINALSFDWMGDRYEIVSTHRDGKIAVCKNGFVKWYRLTYCRGFLYKVNKTSISTEACYYSTNEFISALYRSAVGNNTLARLFDDVLDHVKPAKVNYSPGYSPVDEYVHEIMARAYHVTRLY